MISSGDQLAVNKLTREPTGLDAKTTYNAHGHGPASGISFTKPSYLTTLFVAFFDFDLIFLRVRLPA